MLKNENRPGYKKTTLGQLVTFSSGGTPPKAKTSFWGGTHPWVSAKDMKSPVIYDSLDTLTDAGFEVANIAPKNALLILVRGMTLYKKVPVCLASKDMAFNQDLKALVPSKEVLPNFLLYYLLANESELLGLVDSAGHGTGRLNTDLLRNLPVYLPPLPEQSAIAEVLACWDKAIQTLALKIGKKRLVKQGLMQKLLSGRTRLPGFSKPWKNVRLGNVLSIGNGMDYKHLAKGNVPVFGTGGLMTYVNDKLHSGETVFIGRKGTINKPFYFNGDFWTVDTLFFTHKFKNVLPKFVFFLFQRINWEKHSEASGVPSLSKTVILKLQAHIPPLEEQRAIAAVLSAADEEINALERKLALFKDQKKHLLNNLVTGTIRLPQFCKATRKGDRHE